MSATVAIKRLTTLAKSLEESRTIRGLLVSVVFAFFLMLFSVSAAYLPFEMVAHGHSSIYRPLIEDFHGRAEIGFPTASWYLFSFLLLALGWRLTARVETEWRRGVLRVILIAICISPGVSITGDTAKHPVLPALVSVIEQGQSPLGYVLFAPSFGGTPFVIYPFWLAFWPISITWLVTSLVVLGGQVFIKVRRAVTGVGVDLGALPPVSKET